MLRFIAICAGAISALAAVGLLVAALSDAGARDAISWTLWIGGALIAFVAASGGSPAENYSQSRTVVGGRFTDSPPLPTTPLQYALLGLLCIGVGAVVLVVG